MLRKLAGQTAIYGVSTILSRSLYFLLTPYLTRIMGESEYGVIVEFYAIIPFMLVLLTMGMETGYFRFTAKAQNAEEKKKIFQTTWGAVIVVSLLFFGVVSLFYRQIAEGMNYALTPSYVLITAAIITLDAITAVPFAKLREEGKAVRYAVVRLLNVVINVGLCLFLYSIMPHIEALSSFVSADYMPGYAFAANLVASVTALFLLRSAYKGCAPKIDYKLFKVIFIFSLPLLISGVVGVANDFIDRQLIKYLLPEDMAMSSLGIYGAVLKIGVVMLLFVSMYRLAAEPFFLSNFKKEEFVRANAEAMKYFIIVSVFIFLVITLFLDAFALFIGSDFRQGIFILPIILLANILSGVVLNLSFWYKQSGKTGFAFVITGTGLAVNVALNLVMIPKLGYLGAAWATLGSGAVMVLVSYLLSMRYFPIAYDLKRIGGYMLLGAVLYGIGLVAKGLPSVAFVFVNLLLIATFVLYAIWIEKINVKSIIRSIIRR